MADKTNFFKEQYVLNYFDSLRILMDEQEDLRRAAISAKLSDSQRAAAAAAYLDVTSQIAEFEDAHEALMLKFMLGKVAAPSKALVDKTQKLEADLGAYLAKQLKYRAILEAVTDFVTTWTSITTQPPGDGASAVADKPAGDAPAGSAAAVKVTHLAFLGHDKKNP